MMKTEPPSATGGNGASGGSSSLRSPSPHRNAYEAGLAALKKATDHLNNAANGGADPASKPALLPRPTGRGRSYGSNVHRIKNMFMQMQSPGDEEDGAKIIGKEELKLSLPRASSLNENVNHSALLKLGATVSERVNRFDPKTSGADVVSSIGLSKLQETRRIFEQRTLQEKQAATNRILLKKERASGFQDGRLDVVARFNGSTEALDRLDDPSATAPSAAASVGPGDAVSPTVSQLSAAFEKGDLQNNVHVPHRRSAPALAPKPKVPSRADKADRKVKTAPSGKVAKEELTAAELQQTDGSTHRSREGLAPGEGVTPSSSLTKSESGVQPEDRVTMVTGSELDQAIELDNSPGTEAGGRLVEAEIHAPLEKGEKEPSSSDEKAADSEWRDKEEEEEEEEEEDEDGSRKEDYSEGDLVDVSAYSGLGEEDSGGSQLDDEEDEDDEEAYQPESSCSEIPGLPEEEEPAPPSRKIRFSTEPIRVNHVARWVETAMEGLISADRK